MNLHFIQRAKIEERPHKKGLDSLILLDYMSDKGYDNYTKESLKTIQKNFSEYIFSTFTFGKRTVTVLCNDILKDDIKNILRNLIAGNYHLQESCDFIDWVNDDKFKANNDFWWDVKNNFFFWKENKKFESKLRDFLLNKEE